MKFLLVLLFVPFFAYGDTCDEKFAQRESGLTTAQDAFDCYDSQEQNAKNLIQKAYLKFFIAEYFLEEKLPDLFLSMGLAEKAVLTFGEKYSLEAYGKLTPEDKALLSQGMYIYGLATARYVDIKGKLEAIRRMEDIKKSMNTIMRLKQETTAFYGAHRTLGIFHTKVPAIAGGQIQLAGQYLTLAVQKTLYKNELSLYPGNNFALAEYFFKINKDAEGCQALKSFPELSHEDIHLMKNGHYLESVADVEKGKELFIAKQCP